MITFKQWGEFCAALKKRDVSTMRARDFAASTIPEGQVVIIKHDIEASPEKALKTAHIEAQNGVYASYYFHGFFLRDERAVSCMKEILKLGHEVAYHYDVLDLNDGDYDEALLEFEADLAAFESIGSKIVTVCPHGNPLKQRDGWLSNKDFFKDARIRARFPQIFDIVNDMDGHASGFRYISDAGFTYKLVDNIRDNDKIGEAGDRPISAREVLDICAVGPVTVVSVHSHRLAESRVGLKARRIVFLTLRQLVRVLTRSRTIRRILSPFFELSKRF